MPNLYTITSENITVHAQPEFVESESSSTEGFYIWTYHIRIENKGKAAVQLLNRYWHITDGHGLVQEVRGPGVIGLQPIIEPHDEFEYSSSVNLSTPCGIMQGSYELKTSDGVLFNADIPAFSLDSKEQLRRPN